MAAAMPVFPSGGKRHPAREIFGLFSPAMDLFCSRSIAWGAGIAAA
jgi:hypothetical protein